MVRYKSTRAIFIETVLKFLTENLLDGINLDWEYPGSRGSPGDDKWRFTSLLRELIRAFEKEAINNEKQFRFMLTLAVPAMRRKILRGYDVPVIKHYVDWVDVMGYNLRGSWHRKTDCPTIMKGRVPNVPDSIVAWLNSGMPPHKINLGLAVYGRTYMLKSPEVYGLGAPTMGKGPAGMYTKKSGVLAYYEICLIKWLHMTSQNESACGNPYASIDDMWVAYEDPSSITYKIRTLTQKLNLNGISFWALDFDDFSGQNCGLGKYPLLSTAFKEINRPQRIEL